MQKHVDSVSTRLPIRILGVNGAGQEGGNALVCDGRVLPWLQDSVQVDVWKQWNVTYRDVIVLDQENHILHVYNLTEHDLGNPDNYAELENILLGAAQ